MSIDWTDMGIYPWIAGGGGIVLLLAIVFCFLRLGKLSIPAGVVAGLAGLGTGTALGVVLMGLMGYQIKAPESDNEPADASAGPRPGGGGMMMGGGPPGMGGMRGMPGGGMMGGRGGGPGGFGGFRPSSKAQLASLVGKLELLTSKPLTLELNAEQRQQVRKQLEGLADKEELSDEEAKKRLDALLEVLEDHKDTLTAVGFRWPGERGGGGGFGRPGQAPANPFTAKAARKDLEALDRRLGGGADRASGELLPRPRAAGDGE